MELRSSLCQQRRALFFPSQALPDEDLQFVAHRAHPIHPVAGHSKQPQPVHLILGHQLRLRVVLQIEPRGDPDPGARLQQL